MPRAGSVTDSSRRATVTSPLSSGWRSASITSARNSGNSSRKSTPAVGPAELAGPHLAAAAAEQARLARVVVRRGERRPHQHPVAGLERPGQRVDGGELERLLAGEVGQDARDPLGDAGLARALRPGQHQVVPAGGGHLDGVPRVGHADQVGQVDLLQPLATRARTGAGSPTSARPAPPRAPPRRGARPPPGPATACRARPCRAPSPPRAPAARARRPAGCRAPPRPAPSAAPPAPSAGRRRA